MDIEELQSLATFALEKAIKHQPDEAEIYLETQEYTTIEVTNGSISSTNKYVDMGLGVRIAFDKNVGMSFTTVLDTPTITKTVDTAVASAKRAPSDEEWQGMPTSSGKPPSGQYYYPSVNNITIEDLTQLIDELLEGCKVPGVTDPIIPISGVAGIGNNSAIIANSHGVNTLNRTSFTTASLIPVAIRDGRAGPMVFDFALSRDQLLPNPTEWAGKVANEAYRAAECQTTKLPDTVPVIIQPFALSRLLAILFLPATRADNKNLGTSYLADRLGEEIVPKTLNIFDDGTEPACLASGQYDAEGVTRQKTPIFEDGIFTNFVYDHTTAMKDGTESTGNAGRTDRSGGLNPGSYANPPTVGNSSMVISPGNQDLDSLMSDISLGLYIRGIQGAHQGSPESGDFMGNAFPAYVIRNGEIAESVTGVGIAGNVLELFKTFQGATKTVKTLGNALIPEMKFGKAKVIT